MTLPPLIKGLRSPKLTDQEIVAGLQRHDAKIEQRFFDLLHSYYNLHFTQLFFDEDSRQEIFQTAIIKLWTEIENKTITVIDGNVCRRQRANGYQAMTASLATFMMAFAKNEFREVLRNRKDDDYDDICNRSDSELYAVEENETESRVQIIDECIQSMSPNCIEIITLFYYQQMSLDEIMQLRNEHNTSKDGLKTAKNKCMTTLRQRVNDRIKTI